METFEVEVTRKTMREALDWREHEDMSTEVAEFFEKLMYQCDLAQDEAPSRVVINITNSEI